MSQLPYPHCPDLKSALQGTLAPPEIIETLGLIPVDYVDFSGERKIGQMVVAKALAGEVQDIFGKIRDERFPIQSIVPATYFDHDDDKLVIANITSAFNYRNVDGTDRLSLHAHGRAIDINPWLNPYLNLDGSLVTPRMGERSYNPDVAGTITKGGVVVRAFAERGWDWGGDWTDGHDYQHFDKVS